MDDLAREPILIGSLVDPGGVTRAKAVPAARTDAFVAAGVGASPSWNVFCADDRLAFTEKFSVVGDLRLRIDPSAIREVDPGVAWGPVSVCEQDGNVASTCTRNVLARTVDRLAAAGITATPSPASSPHCPRSAPSCQGRRFLPSGVVADDLRGAD